MYHLWWFGPKTFLKKVIGPKHLCWNVLCGSILFIFGGVCVCVHAQCTSPFAVVLLRLAAGVLCGDWVLPPSPPPSSSLLLGVEPVCRERWYILTGGQERAASEHSPNRKSALRGEDRGRWWDEDQEKTLYWHFIFILANQITCFQETNS